MSWSSYASRWNRYAGKPPRMAIWIILTLVVLSWLPLVFIAKSWVTKSAEPRVHLFQDMDHQPKFKAQAFNPTFADHRAMRPRIDGTIARDQLHEDEAFYRGKFGDEWVTRIPHEVTEQFVRRGQNRFNIFCATCHGYAGYGDGPTHQRAREIPSPQWIPPTSLHTQMVRDRPVGHLFNTITHGIRNMVAYGPQIPPEDRWAIVSYIRALQLSQKAALEQVPVDKRDTLR